MDKVLTTAVLFLDRAQKRIAHQRLDSKMELGRIVDIRKKVFNEVKVRIRHSSPWFLPNFK